MTGSFSRRTIISAIDVIECELTQAEASSLFIELGQPISRWVRGEAVSLKKRMNDLKGFIDDQPNFLTDEGVLEPILVEKAARFLSRMEERFKGALWSEPTPLPEHAQRFKSCLDQDGFIVSEGVLRSTLPVDANMNLPAAQSELFDLLNCHNLTTAHGHLEQALDAHARSNWAGANSQLRSFLEGMLDDLAEKLDPSLAGSPSGHGRRAKLASIGFLDQSLNEWSNDGKGFFEGLMKRLHPHGSHPGLSDEDDCTFRLHVILLSARLLMRRFDNWGSSP